MFDYSFPVCAFFFFLFVKVEISSRTLIPLFMPGSIHSGSAEWDDWDQRSDIVLLNVLVEWKAEKKVWKDDMLVWDDEILMWYRRQRMSYDKVKGRNSSVQRMARYIKCSESCMTLMSKAEIRVSRNETAAWKQGILVSSWCERTGPDNGVIVVAVVAFPLFRGFGENVRPFIPRLRF